MTGSRTIAGPQEYWDRYYAQQFRFGLGTEDILAALMQVLPVGMWADLGSGSESMLWAIGLRDFSLRCQSLTATVAIDCLTGHPPNDPNLPAAGFELVTQFGLLGLCRDAEHFTDCFTAAHQLVKPGGWATGANWIARNPYQRVELTDRLYQIAAARAGIELLLTRRVPITADPDFTAVWTYIGRKHRHGHCGARTFRRVTLLRWAGRLGRGRTPLGSPTCRDAAVLRGVWRRARWSFRTPRAWWAGLRMAGCPCGGRVRAADLVPGRVRVGGRPRFGCLPSRRRGGS